jgi:hypothetical protein
MCASEASLGHHSREVALPESGSRGDRRVIDTIVEAARPNQYGLRTIVHEIVPSDLLRNK